MQALRFLLLPSGRLHPQAFVAAAIAVYVAGAASQWLTAPGVIAHSGLWPFIAAQAVLIWIWFALHARRLHDAGRPMTLAAGASVLYALSVVLLLIVATAFFTTSASAAGNGSATGALGLILLVTIVSTLAGAASYDVGWAIVAILVALAFVPVAIAIAVTLWAATRPSAKEPAP